MLARTDVVEELRFLLSIGGEENIKIFYELNTLFTHCVATLLFIIEFLQ